MKRSETNFDLINKELDIMSQEDKEKRLSEELDYYNDTGREQEGKVSAHKRAGIIDVSETVEETGESDDDEEESREAFSGDNSGKDNLPFDRISEEQQGEL